MLTSEEFEIPKTTKDFAWAFGLNRLTLKIFGIWTENLTEASPCRSFITPAMSLAVFMFLCVPQFNALILVMDNLSFVMDNLMTCVTCLVSGLKLFFIWRTRQDLSPVVKSMEFDWFRPKQFWELSEMIRKASFARTYLRIGILLTVCCYSGFAFSPLIGVHVRTINKLTDSGDRYLMMQSHYPFDYTTSPRFELTYASQMVSAIIAPIGYIVPDSYFVALVTHLSGQFKILGIKLENLVKCDNSKVRSDVDEELRELIKKHAHLMRMSLIVERSFSSMMMTDMIGESVIVCMMGCQVIGKVSPVQVLTLALSLSTLMLLFFVDCLASELLTFDSSMIFHKVYNAKWYLVPRRIVKELMMMLIVTRVPREITIGKMFPLSMVTFGMLLEKTVSYISILFAASNR